MNKDGGREERLILMLSAQQAVIHRRALSAVLFTTRHSAIPRLAV
jgi:hypothetical protein